MSALIFGVLVCEPATRRIGTAHLGSLTA